MNVHQIIVSVALLVICAVAVHGASLNGLEYSDDSLAKEQPQSNADEAASNEGDRSKRFVAGPVHSQVYSYLGAYPNVYRSIHYHPIVHPAPIGLHHLHGPVF